MPINKKTLKLNQKGIGLIETIAALAIAVIVITALVSLAVFTLRASAQSKTFLQGSKAATEQLELLRAYRDTEESWAVFVQDLLDNNCTDPDPTSPDTTTYTPRCYMSTAGVLDVLSVPSPADDSNCLTGSYVAGNETPQMLCWSFEVSDIIENDAVELTDDILRVRVETRWRVGSQINTSYVYTDISNWRMR